MATPRAHAEPLSLISLLWKRGSPDGRAPLCKWQTTPPRPPLVIRTLGKQDEVTSQGMLIIIATTRCRYEPQGIQKMTPLQLSSLGSEYRITPAPRVGLCYHSVMHLRVTKLFFSEVF